MEEIHKKVRGKSQELTYAQKDQIDAYFHCHDIKLTKKNLKIVSKALGIPHRRVVEYVNSRQKESKGNVHEEYIKMIGALREINAQIKEIWRRFEGYSK